MKVRYICKECGKVNSINSFWKWFWTPHFGNKKRLKCRHCDARKHFMNRMDYKWSMIDWPKEKEEKKNNMEYKTCKDCIYETECNLNTEACERFKDKELYNKIDKE